MAQFEVGNIVFSLAVRWGNQSTKLSNYHQSLIEKTALGFKR